MNVLDVVASTDHAAFATDGRGCIVAFNAAAERLLGYPEWEAFETRCYDLIRGTDPFGNRYCDKSCALANMARRNEPVRDFEMRVRHASGRTIPVSVSAMVLSGPSPFEHTIVHLLQPLERGIESDTTTSGDGHHPRRREGEDVVPLTPRETEVLALLARGTTTSEVATVLCISVDTVRTHVKNTLKKLGVHSRVEAISIAHRSRLI